MSWLVVDDDLYETIVDSRPCSCGGKCNGHCNGSFGIGSRPRSPAEYQRIKAARRDAHEQSILDQADAIRARRNAAMP